MSIEISFRTKIKIKKCDEYVRKEQKDWPTYETTKEANEKVIFLSQARDSQIRNKNF